MHGRHESALDRERFVEDLCHRRNAVRGARGIRDDPMARAVVRVVVYAHDERHVRVVRHSRDDDALRPGIEMRLSFVARREASGRLQDHVDTEFSPGETLGVGDREGSQPVLADRDRVLAARHILPHALVRRIEHEQVGHRLEIPDVVYGDDLEVRAALERGTQEVPADPAEAVDGDASHRPATGECWAVFIRTPLVGEHRQRSTLPGNVLARMPLGYPVQTPFPGRQRPLVAAGGWAEAAALRPISLPTELATHPPRGDATRRVTSRR